MINQKDLEKEYKEFVIKITKLSKEFTDAIDSLSPENLQKFKSEMKSILPIGLTNLIQLLNK